MSKWLYFKRSNGDVDCLPEDTVTQHSLNTTEKLLAFIGDDSVTGLVLSKPVPFADIVKGKVVTSTVKKNAHYIKRAQELYESKQSVRHIDGFDLSNTFEFDYQRRQGGQVVLKKVSGGVEVRSVADTEALATELQNYLVSLATAYQADITAISNGEYSLTNLNNI